MKTCYHCTKPLTALNRSQEHILLNAIGGKLTSEVLLCKTCNIAFGADADAALAKSTEALASYLGIKRDRGTNRNIRTKTVEDDVEYYLEDGFKPVRVKPIIHERSEGNQVELSIVANSEKQYREIAQSYVRKNPKLKMEDFLAAKKNSKSYLGKHLNIELKFGGPEIFPAIVKTAINFYLYSGGQRSQIEALLPYVAGKVKMDCVWLHTPDVPLYIPQEGEVSHVVHVVGEREEKILYAYVELFNCQCFIVKLNENYLGPDFEAIYAQDVFQQVELEVSIGKKYNRKELLGFFENRDFSPNGRQPIELARQRFHRVANIGNKRHFDRHIRQVVSDIVNRGLALFPNDFAALEKWVENEADAEVQKFIESRRVDNVEPDLTSES